MAQIEFFHPVIDTQSVNKISEIMSWAEKSLQIEMCYVTEFGTSLLEKHADHLFRDGSFIIVANESMNDIEGLNELAKKDLNLLGLLLQNQIQRKDLWKG